MKPLSMLIKHEEEDDFDLLEILEADPGPEGWSGRLAEAVAILQDLQQQEIWERAVAVCYWALDRTEDLPVAKMELVARLYWCLIHDLDAENLVWSIAIKLKGVGYESEWDPMKDPEVREHLTAMG